MCAVAGCIAWLFFLMMGYHIYTIFSAFVLALLIGIPIDRLGDNKFGTLVQMEDNEINEP